MNLVSDFYGGDRKSIQCFDCKVTLMISLTVENGCKNYEGLIKVGGYLELYRVVLHFESKRTK